MRPIFPFCFQIFLEDEEHEPVQKKITKQSHCLPFPLFKISKALIHAPTYRHAIPKLNSIIT